MKKYIYIIIGVIGFSIGLAFTSCERYDEMPPRQETSVTSKRYKLPDPVILSADEQAEVAQIRAEYNASQKETE